MAGDRSPQPPKEAWESWKQEIHGWYLTHNWTCHEIQKALRHRRFIVSERQIKNRLSEWKFERKKTPYTHYLAMSVLSDCCRGEIEFEVPKRETRVIYSSQKVKKECERVKKRYNSPSCAETLNWPSLDDAQCLLREADISWRPTETRHTFLTASRPKHVIACWDGGLRDLPYHIRSSMGGHTMTTDHCTSSAARGSERRDSLAVSEPIADSRLSDYRKLKADQSLPIVQNRPPVYTPQSSATPCSLHSIKDEPSSPSCCRSPMSPVFSPGLKPASPVDTKELFSGGSSLQSYPVCPLPEASSSRLPFVKVERHLLSSRPCSMGEAPAFQGSGFTKRSSSTSSKSHRCRSPHSHPDFDFNGTINSLQSQDSMVKSEGFGRYRTLDEISLDQDIGAEEHKLTASQWALPYYNECESNVSEDVLQLTKERSMAALRYALTNNRERILPCLSWTILILGQGERMQQLAELLKASYAVINEDPNMRGSFTYAVPYRYAWAWASNNEKEMDESGDDLQRSYEQISMLWGEEHPNFFVSTYLYAWHLLRRANYAEALELLAKHLPVCEAKLGRNDLLTISCLTVFSRAHEEMSKPLEAIHYLRKAMTATQRLEEDPEIHRPVLQRFRLSLLARHAALLFSVHDHVNAEKQFRRVLQLRRNLYGLQDVTTLHAAQDVGTVLLSMGQGALWKDLVDYMQKGNHWEQIRDWCRLAKEPPPPPPAPPSWWSSQEQKRPSVNSAFPGPNLEMKFSFSLSGISRDHSKSRVVSMSNA